MIISFSAVFGLFANVGFKRSRIYFNLHSLQRNTNIQTDHVQTKFLIMRKPSEHLNEVFNSLFVVLFFRPMKLGKEILLIRYVNFNVVDSLKPAIYNFIFITRKTRFRDVVHMHYSFLSINFNVIKKFIKSLPWSFKCLFLLHMCCSECTWKFEGKLAQRGS